jgi:hypothetical protein
VFHVELRQFPHSFNAFNVDDAELWAIVEPWINDRVFEAGELRWNPRAGTILILEGPHIPVDELSMGRGWRTAQREGEDVTERVLAHAREVIAEMNEQASGVAEAGVAGSDLDPAEAGDVAAVDSGEPAQDGTSAGDALSLGVALAALLGPDAQRLLAAWREVSTRAAGLAPSEALALAERELARQQQKRG